jgi:hypothetical protein
MIGDLNAIVMIDRNFRDAMAGCMASCGFDIDNGVQGKAELIL